MKKPKIQLKLSKNILKILFKNISHQIPINNRVILGIHLDLLYENYPKPYIYAGSPSSIMQWNIAMNTCFKSMETNTESDLLLNLTIKWRNILLSGSNNLIKIWDTRAGKSFKHLAGHIFAITCLISINQKGKNLIASGSYDTTIKIWDLDINKCIKTLSGHTNSITTVLNIQHKGLNCLASASLDNTVRIWDLNKGACIKTISAEKGYFENLIYIGLREKSLIASAGNKIIKFWDIDSGGVVKQWNDSSDAILALICFAWKGDKIIASGSKDSIINIWSFQKDKIIQRLEGHNMQVNCLLYLDSRSKNLIVSGSSDMTIKIWNFESGICINTISTHNESIKCIVQSLR